MTKLSLFLFLFIFTAHAMELKDDETTEETPVKRIQPQLISLPVFIDESFKDYKSHYTNDHKPEVQLKCPIPGCTETFEYKKTLAAHVTRHKRSAEFKCQLCPISYHSLKILERHIKKQHS